jgi:hypothetical protein
MTTQSEMNDFIFDPKKHKGTKFVPPRSWDRAHKRGDNHDLLCQDCCTALFRWFMTRVDWVRILKEQGRTP